MPIHELRGPLEQARGVIGRYPDDDEEYHFVFDDVGTRGIHTLGVRKPLLVKWYVGSRLEASEVLPPWRGWARHRADRVVEKRPPP